MKDKEINYTNFTNYAGDKFLKDSLSPGVGVAYSVQRLGGPGF